MKNEINYARTVRPIGFERYEKSEGWIIKVSEKKWKRKSMVIWEKCNGPIPEGYNLRYKDGDNKNCTIDNLICISKSVHIMLNQRYKNIVTPENIDTVILLAELNEIRHRIARENGLTNKDGCIKDDKKEMNRLYYSSHVRINGKWEKK